MKQLLTDREEIDEIVGEIATKGMIGMQLAMTDGSPKHHKKVLKEAGDLIEALLVQARKQVVEEVLGLIGSDVKQHWDDDDWFCNKCEFQPTDDTKNCICVYQNELRATLREEIQGASEKPKSAKKSVASKSISQTRRRNNG